MRMSKFHSAAIILLLISLLIPVTSPTQDYDYFTVKRVVDGNTLLLKDGQRVRLIGVDTPESYVSQKAYRDAERSGRDIETIKKSGKRALDFVKSLVKPGDKIVVRYDQQRIDKYGRILGYVYLEDGTFLNAEIIKQGYGRVDTGFPFKYLDDFRRYEREAREKKRGLWSE
jgi:micrococcal nuclease